MIRAMDAVQAARKLIGTPYAELDCINLVKRVIRTAPGGVPKYTTATTVTLWASFDAAPKYRDLVQRRVGIDHRAGVLLFKGKPWGHDHQPSHVGIGTGRGTVIHASSAKGEVVETLLSESEGWTLSAVHRYITPEEPEEEVERVTYSAIIKTPKGGDVNLRSGNGTAYPVITKLPSGTKVTVMKEYPGWCFAMTPFGTGYISVDYVQRIEEEEPEEPEDQPDPAEEKARIIIEMEGRTLIMEGVLRVAKD